MPSRTSRVSCAGFTARLTLNPIIGKGFAAEGHGFEKWANFPRQRERLYKLIRDTKAARVVLLSGDRHFAELSVTDADIDYPLYDLTSSGMNQANKRYRTVEPNRHRVAVMDVGNNFGMVRVDWAKADPVVSLEIHDEDGDVTVRHKLPLSRLQPKLGKKAKGDKALVDEARRHAGAEWAAAFTVRSVGGEKAGARVYLNSEKDFRDGANFAVVLDMKAMKGDLAAAKVGDVKAHFLGRKVRVTGKVTLARERPQISVTRLKQVEVAE